MVLRIIRAPLRSKGSIIRFGQTGPAPERICSVDVAQSVVEAPERPLRVAFFSGIVTVKGITGTYPGGLAAFDRDFPNAHANATLRLVSYMSCDDLEALVARWEAHGLRLGESIAIGEMMHGELVACPGVQFEKVGDTIPPQWLVK